MGEVYFYHLTRNPVDVTLTSLIEKAMGQGWRVLVRGGDQKRLNALDQRLWLLGGDSGFLPHGLSGGSFDREQTVLLTMEHSNENQADCLMCIDSAEISAEEIVQAKRTCVLFDGHDDAALNIARGQWKKLTDAGCGAQYWSEESGRWEKKAEKADG